MPVFVWPDVPLEPRSEPFEPPIVRGAPKIHHRSAVVRQPSARICESALYRGDVADAHSWRAYGRRLQSDLCQFTTALQNELVQLDLVVKRAKHAGNCRLLGERREREFEAADLAAADVGDRCSSLYGEDVVRKRTAADYVTEETRVEVSRPSQPGDPLDQQGWQVRGSDRGVLESSLDPWAVHRQHNVAFLQPVRAIGCGRIDRPALRTIPPDPTLCNVVSTQKSRRRGLTGILVTLEWEPCYELGHVAEPHGRPLIRHSPTPRDVRRLLSQAPAAFA